jgi:hypothetical protein
MLECKFRYEGEESWNYREFKDEDEMLKTLDSDPRQIAEYKSRPKQLKNPILNWFHNVKNTKKNLKIVQGSPYARLSLALKARKLIIGLIIPIILYRFYDMIVNFRGEGPMGIVTRLFMIGVAGVICWKLYSTIPQAKKQLEYFKKYPHTINYVPTNTKNTVNDILETIKKNKEKKG